MKRSKKTLDFTSVLLDKTERYSAELMLPDYIYSSDGRLDRKQTIDILLDEEYGRIEMGVGIARVLYYASARYSLFQPRRLEVFRRIYNVAKGVK